MIYNIDPKLWGKHFWATIHYITFSVPDSPTEEYKQNLLKFFESLKFLLPCENCRKHYSENLLKYPLTNDILSSRVMLINWAVNLHNEVNTRNGTKILTVEEVKNIYLPDKPNSSYDYKSIITIFLLILLMVVLMYYVKYRN